MNEEPIEASKDMGTWPLWHVVMRARGTYWSDTVGIVRVIFSEGTYVGAPNEDRAESTIMTFARLRGLDVLSIDIAPVQRGDPKIEVEENLVLDRPYQLGDNYSQPVSDCINREVGENT